MMAAWVSGVSICGPGLASFGAFRDLVRSGQPYAGGELPPIDPSLINARERRRASPNVKLALSVAMDAVAMSGIDPGGLPAVFGASQGEGTTTHTLLDAVTAETPFVSPTLFHNSVHNTPAGFWSIATGSNAPCDSVAGGDMTFGAALLSALTFATVERSAVLLVVCDSPLPKPLADHRPIATPFATALVLEPARPNKAMARIGVPHGGESGSDSTTAPELPGLAALMEGNPAARALPLLEALAGSAPRAMTVAHASDAAITLKLDPC